MAIHIAETLRGAWRKLTGSGTSRGVVASATAEPLTRSGRKSATKVQELSAVEWLWEQGGASRQVRILEVGSLHLRLKTPTELKRLRRREEELFNGLRFPIQRLSLPVPLDLSDYLDGIRKHAADDPIPARGKLLVDKAEHIESLKTEKHLVRWRNLIVILTDEPRSAERIQYVRQGLEEIGLDVRELAREEIAQVWLEMLNPAAAADNPLRPGDEEGDGFLYRVDPGLLDFKLGKWFRVGAKFCRVYSARNYPRSMSLQRFLETYRLDRRVIISQHIHPTEKGLLEREIANSIGELESKMSGGLERAERTKTSRRKKDAERLLEKLAGDSHAVLDFCLYLLVRGDTREELEEVSRSVERRFDSKGITLRQARFWEHASAFQAILPAAVDPLRVKTRRNLPAASMPATFPYANAELNQGQGIVFGINKDTGNLVIYDPWEQMNPHSIFIGTSGSGKTFTLNEQLAQFWSWGVMIRQLDIEGDKGLICQALGGQRVRIAPHAGNIINPLEIRRPPLDPSLLVNAEAEEPANGLAATIQRNLILFGLLLPDITPIELARAERVLIDLYRSQGIDFGTDFGDIARDGWPTWKQLQPMLVRDEDTRRLGAVMQGWTEGSLSGIFDGPTTVNLDNQYVCLDLRDVMTHRLAKGPVFFVAMTYLWDDINRDWRERKILDIDEFGILGDSEDALEFIWRVSKTARRRKCRLQAATQDPADFLSGRNPAATKYALGIINNAATKVVGYLEEKALEQIATQVRLSDAEKDLIAKLRREDKLVIVGESRAHVEVVASTKQLAFLDPEKYAATAAGRKEARNACLT